MIVKTILNLNQKKKLFLIMFTDFYWTNACLHDDLEKILYK